MRLFPVLLLLAACKPVDVDDKKSGDPDVVDLRLSEADVPALVEGQELWWGPDVQVEPYSEKLFCLYGTYEGDDIGMHSVKYWQNSFGHHLALFGTSTNVLDVADGEVVDCSESSEMTSIEPMLIPDVINGNPMPEMQIPDGMAFKLRKGDRWVIQAHYVNTSSDTIRAQDPVVVDFVDPATVDTWVAPLVVNHGEFEIPAQSELTSSFTCDFPEEHNLLYVIGHMHEWGQRMSISVEQGGNTETLYEVPDWDVLFRDDAPVNGYSDQPYLLEAGSRMTVSCTWNNGTDAAIGFPGEMCAAIAMGYPALTSTICSD